MNPRRPKKAAKSMAEDARRMMDAEVERDENNGMKEPHSRTLRHQVGLGGSLGTVPVDYRRLRHLPLHKPLPSFTGDVTRYLETVEAWMPPLSLSDLRAPPVDLEDMRRMEDMQVLGKLDDGPPIAGDVLMVTTVQGFVGRARKCLADGGHDDALAYCMLISETFGDLDHLLAQARSEARGDSVKAEHHRAHSGRDERIVRLSDEGYAASKIKERLGLDLTVQAINAIIRKERERRGGSA